LRSEKRGDAHEVSILIRLGRGEYAGRTPSKVSALIIRPPQHGHPKGVSSPSRIKPVEDRSRQLKRPAEQRPSTTGGAAPIIINRIFTFSHIFQLSAEFTHRHLPTNPMWTKSRGAALS
jgi:hypothetical protein